MDTLSKYTYFDISKNITSDTFSLILKLSKAIRISFRFYCIMIVSGCSRKDVDGFRSVTTGSN